MAITVKQNSSKTYVPYTGYVALDVRAFNPTNAEYEAITGKTLTYQLEYNADDNGVTTHRVLVREVTRNTFTFMEYRIGNTPWESTNNPGSFQWVDKYLNFGWGTSPDEVKSNGFDANSAKKSFKGLEDFAMLIKRMARTNKDTDIVTVVSGLDDIDINDVIKLKKKAVNKLIAECNIAPDDSGRGGYPYASVASAISVYTSGTTGKMRQVVSVNKDVVTAPDVKDGTIVPSSFWVNKVREKLEKSQSTQYPLIPSNHIFDGMDIKDVDLSASSDDLPF